MKPVLISGVQPTGKLHIGNYLGALRNFVELQNSGKYQCYFFVADLHALIANPNPKELQKNIISLEVDYLAAGLDTKKSTIFVQSTLPVHTELASILNTFTPVSELMRMTAFKEKVIQHIKLKEGEEMTRNEFDKVMEKSNFGLADYPVLMAADILLYGAQFVPVGDDQLQHLELTRTLARKFNHKFGKTFVEPKPLLTEIPRLMSLDDPSKKMSKSRPAGCLFLDDSPIEIRGKIKRAVTDSGKEVKYDAQNKPAISNLIKIYAAFSNKTIKTIELRYRGRGYGDFKKDLAEVVVKGLAPFQKKKKELSSQTAKIKKIIVNGNKKAAKVSGKTLEEVKKKIGLII